MNEHLKYKCWMSATTVQVSFSFLSDRLSVTELDTLISCQSYHNNDLVERPVYAFGSPGPSSRTSSPSSAKSGTGGRGPRKGKAGRTAGGKKNGSQSGEAQPYPPHQQQMQQQGQQPQSDGIGFVQTGIARVRNYHTNDTIAYCFAINLFSYRRSTPVFPRKEI